jgi:hypothetical protein
LHFSIFGENTQKMLQNRNFMPLFFGRFVLEYLMKYFFYQEREYDIKPNSSDYDRRIEKYHQDGAGGY